MPEQTESLRVLLPPDLKERVLEATRQEPRYTYNDRPSHSAFAREAFEFFLLHKFNYPNSIVEQSPTPAPTPSDAQAAA